jgi:hypothetical protein
MARYKEYSYSQGKFIPIHFSKQILPGTFEYTLNYLIDVEPVLHDPQHEKGSSLWARIFVISGENGRMPLK